MNARMLIAVVAVLAACGGDDSGQTGGPCEYNGRTYELGQTWPEGDGCNACSCTSSGAACTKRACDDAGVDADPMSCMPSGGCPDGPACGTICCAPGEKCVSGACKCGGAAACTQGNTCQAAGPLGESACGSVCCGAIGPCPQ